MAKKRKKVEKLGNVIGETHLVWGGVLILFGVIMLLSVFDYAPNQDIFRREYFDKVVQSTEITDYHICGKLGATISLFVVLIFGVASYMLPILLLWFGVGCFRRKMRVITKWEILAVVSAIISLAVLSSVFQDFLGSSAPQNAQFPRGWGGRVGECIYNNFTKSLLDVVGNSIVFGSVYFVSLVVIFVDSPTEAANEVGKASVCVGKWLLKILKAVVLGILSLPKKLVLSMFSRRNKDFDASDIKIDQLKSESKVEQQNAEKSEIEDDLDFESLAIDDIDLKELSDFANEMGQTKQKNSALVDVVEVLAEDYPQEISNFVEAEDEVNVVDFTGVELNIANEIPKSVNALKQHQEKVSEVKVVSSQQSEESSVVEDKPRAIAKKKNSKYVYPSLKLLKSVEKNENAPKENYGGRMSEIIRVIGEFGVKVLPGEAFSGPVITRYEVKPAPGVKISRITNLEDDITAGIKAEKVRMIAPVPGRGTVGIEVPNVYRQNVSMREVLESKQWRNNSYEIPIALGKDATGVPIVANLKKMTHALIAGSTNSGKSVCINTVIVSMLYKMSPEDLRLIMIDPKMVELQGYNSIPHMLIPVVSDVKKAAAALKWLTGEMMRRYTIFQKSGVRNIDGFNAKILKDKEEMIRADAEFASMTPEERQAALQASAEVSCADVDIPKEKMPYIVCIIDELADLMNVVGKEVEPYIARITQLARAAGIHMIIATQRPDVKVITGKIKNNLPTRIAFKVTSQIDSRTILDSKGAESLIGWGDMLFLNNGAPDIVRAQGAFLSDEEIEAVVEALKVNGEPQYAEDVQAQIDASDEDSDEIGEGEGGKYNDSETVKAINIIRETGKVSISFLQRKMGIGYPRAAKIVDELESRGLIGPDNGTGKREILL